tara:strand:+ start:2703 stop:3062 length:360 start_codon:yes stop_codon:yes gene_type:complete
MKRSFLNSKIHNATVTGSNINYEGSCMIDLSLLNSANIKPYEKIDIYDITNGERLTTYAIPGPADSSEICVNGACCHKININDKVIICSYATLSNDEIENHHPTIIYLDNKNNITDKTT